MEIRSIKIRNWRLKIIKGVDHLGEKVDLKESRENGDAYLKFWKLIQWILGRNSLVIRIKWLIWSLIQRN